MEDLEGSFLLHVVGAGGDGEGLSHDSVISSEGSVFSGERFAVFAEAAAEQNPIDPLFGDGVVRAESGVGEVIGGIERRAEFEVSALQ